MRVSSPCHLIRLSSMYELEAPQSMLQVTAIDSADIEHDIHDHTQMETKLAIEINFDLCNINC